MGQPAIVDIPAGSDFPLENLPYGAVVRAPVGAGVGTANNNAPRLAVALGDSAVDLAALAEHGLLCTGPILSRHADVFARPTLNAFLELGPGAWAEARACLTRLLSAREGALRDALQRVREAVLFPRPDAQGPSSLSSSSTPSSSSYCALPFAIGDYTDFYASRHHATNVGAMFRGKGNELQPNWLHLPVGYHGRASSVVVSGVPVRRPWGQVVLPPPPSQPAPAASAAAAASATAAAPSAPSAAAASEPPSFCPSRAVDYELEVAAVVGRGSDFGGPGFSARDALPQGRLFGLVLMNDWSARDVQRWEGVPLGPFCSKNWATQVSPWVVTAEALEPYRLDLPAQADPRPLPYLTDEGAADAVDDEDEEEGEDGEGGGERAPRPPPPSSSSAFLAPLRPGALASYDLSLRAELLPQGASRATRLCDTNLRHLYWSFPQMAAHHAAGGCNLRAGDLLGSGTVSGPGEAQRACLLESTGNGCRPFGVADPGTRPGAARERRYLEDGDEVVTRGWCGGGGGEGEEEGAGGGGGGGGGLPRIGFGECRGRLLPALRRRS